VHLRFFVLFRTWSLLTHALGGIICSGFSMLKNEEMAYTFSPASFSHDLEGRPDAEQPWTLRVATSPVEVACTENLNSLQKLLPCRGEAGLLSLLHPLAFASSPFKSLRFLAFSETETESANSYPLLRAELRAQLTVVLPVPQDGEAPFTLPDLFHHSGQPGVASPLGRPCVASSSRILLRLRKLLPPGGELPAEGGESEQDKRPDRDAKRSQRKGEAEKEEVESRGGTERARLAAASKAVASTGASKFTFYSVDASSDLVVFDAFPVREERNKTRENILRAKEVLLPLPDAEGLSGRLDVERQQTGRGTASSKLERMEGSWLMVFRNRGAFGHRSVRYFDNFPPFLFPLFHTARVSWKPLPRKPLSPLSQEAGGAEAGAATLCHRAFSPVSKQLQLTGAEAARALNLRLLASSSSFAPTFVSLAFSLPPRCQIEFSVGVEKRHWAAGRFSFSPDKGSDVPGAIVLDMPASSFFWPPPRAVLEAPLSCSVDSACAALPLVASPRENARESEKQETLRNEEPLSLDLAAEGLYARGQRDSWNWQITEGMIVHLPLPDFSMPFNVIALSGTVLTLFYGSVFRITTMEW
ncbi:Gpi16 subunit, GPI transamidase component protein, partial [Toxoplasma gondii p89]